MTQKKEKIPLTGQVRLPEALDRAIDTESARLNKFKYEVVQAMWDAWQEKSAGPSADDAQPRIPDEYEDYPGMLVEVLLSGDENLIGLVTTPLEFARKQLRPRPAGKSRKGE